MNILPYHRNTNLDKCSYQNYVKDANNALKLHYSMFFLGVYAFNNTSGDSGNVVVSTFSPQKWNQASLAIVKKYLLYLIFEISYDLFWIPFSILLPQIAF